MCEPISIILGSIATATVTAATWTAANASWIVPTVTGISAVAGATTGAIGGIQSYQASEYKAENAENQAETAHQQALEARRSGIEQEEMHRLKIAQTKGKQRAGYGASGVLADEGSAMETILDTTKMGEYDALTIRHNTSKQAWGFEQQADNYKTEAGLNRKQSSASILGSVGTVANSFGEMGLLALETGVFKKAKKTTGNSGFSLDAYGI
jgi:hypothetical protein